jgi:NADH-quinone oxidoreductase subunit J
MSGLVTVSLGGRLPVPGALLLAAADWHLLFFLLFAAVACVGAIMVVVTENIVRMALHLVLSLAATAGLFFLAGAEFIGSMQLMIYVGGTLVLLVFGVMLTAQSQFISLKTPPGDRLLAGIVATALLAVLLQSAVSVEAWRRPAKAVAVPPSATPLGMALVGVRVDDPAGATSSRQRSGYLLPFEIVSVHLLVVLVGAAYLARAKRRTSPRPVDLAASVVPSRAQPQSAGRRPVGREEAGRAGERSVLSVGGGR